MGVSKLEEDAFDVPSQRDLRWPLRWPHSRSSLREGREVRVPGGRAGRESAAKPVEKTTRTARMPTSLNRDQDVVVALWAMAAS